MLFYLSSYYVNYCRFCCHSQSHLYPDVRPRKNYTKCSLVLSLVGVLGELVPVVAVVVVAESFGFWQVIEVVGVGVGCTFMRMSRAGSNLRFQRGDIVQILR
jgi:hypothetical protein